MVPPEGTPVGKGWTRAGGWGTEPLTRDPHLAETELRRIRWDTWSGMFYSDLTAYFIILARAVTLHVAGITDINTAAEAASALRPLAGDFAFILFALGILGVGLIGVPVLAGSGAYALSEAMGWKSGLERPGERRARLLRHHLHQRACRTCHPIPADQSHEGAVLECGDQWGRRGPPDGSVILLVSKKSVMGAFTASQPFIVLGWIATVVMGAAAVWMFVPT